jgi:WD40 repeat protein
MGSIYVLILFSYPSNILQILDAHDDEVWFVQFSHDGKYLATASNDQTAIIWEVISDDEIYASVLF